MRALRLLVAGVVCDWRLLLQLQPELGQRPAHGPELEQRLVGLQKLKSQRLVVATAVGTCEMPLVRAEVGPVEHTFEASLVGHKVSCLQTFANVVAPSRK